ncbi:hypothetical protein BCR35DRAFT_328084 [Leucosporidium creatinivorum]|uniref:Uncharacterized protein n=1 Tax=Leucosporidium creatinivorum TaxID=106004 RepID=A0A1Y2G271_9BASI|nr:hypothetical protein BCR35DRAFT_328084 [Leucosporidium creatinivorum]
MLTRTLALTLTASLAALALAAPLPGGGDGEDIKFAEIKKVNDDEFKKTNFNVHDKTEHDANFNQVEASNKDALSAAAFAQADDGGFFRLARRQIGVDGISDVAVTDPLEGDDLGIEDDGVLGANLNFGFDLDTGIDAQFDDADSFGGLSLLKRGGGDDDGENIKALPAPSPSLTNLDLPLPQFAQLQKINDDRFKKTNFNVHDATEHDANFNQVEAKKQNTAQAVAFAKNDGDDGKHHRSNKHDDDH